MDKIASQIKVLLLFGMVGVNEVGIRWKDNALIRGQGGRIKMRSPPKVLTGNFRPSQLSFFLS